MAARYSEYNGVEIDEEEITRLNSTPGVPLYVWLASFDSYDFFTLLNKINNSQMLKLTPAI